MLNETDCFMKVQFINVKLYFSNALIFDLAMSDQFPNQMTHTNITIQLNTSVNNVIIKCNVTSTGFKRDIK